jgi:hypothetical protein
VKCEEVIQGEVTDYNFDICSTTFTSCIVIINLLISRCMASTLVRTGFVRGSMTQGNGCYQHRCTNNSLEVNIFHSSFCQSALGLLCILWILLSFSSAEFSFLGVPLLFSDIHHDYHKYSCTHQDHPCNSSILVFLFPYFFLIRYIAKSDVVLK